MSEGMWAADDEQDEHPLKGYLKVLRAMNKPALQQEVEELRDWKESAMKQLRKAEHLREYLADKGYLGWDLYDAALDLLTKNCPCCGYPNCGHKHPIS